MLIIGLSRGGTHIFWSFIASHPDLKNRYKEHPHLTSQEEIGFLNKVIMEVKMLVGLKNRSHELSSENLIVDKIVCSRNRSRRPTNNIESYVNYFDFEKQPIIFLVKPIELQAISWMRGGASIESVLYWYKLYTESWANISKYCQNCFFVKYEDFCNDPIRITKLIWKKLGLRDVTFPESIEWAPKKYKGTNSVQDLLSSVSFSPTRFVERQWGLSPAGYFVESLKSDGQKNTKEKQLSKDAFGDYKYPFEFINFNG